MNWRSLNMKKDTTGKHRLALIASMLIFGIRIPKQRTTWLWDRMEDIPQLKQVTSI